MKLSSPAHFVVQGTEKPRDEVNFLNSQNSVEAVLTLEAPSGFFVCFVMCCSAESKTGSLTPSAHPSARGFASPRLPPVFLKEDAGFSKPHLI